MLATFQNPQVQKAFGLTLRISLLVVAIQAVFGTLVAWMLVRDDFRGKRFINGLIDLPFAVSPVVVGYMLLLLLGRQLYHARSHEHTRRLRRARHGVSHAVRDAALGP